MTYYQISLCIRNLLVVIIYLTITLVSSLVSSTVLANLWNPFNTYTLLLFVVLFNILLAYHHKLLLSCYINSLRLTAYGNAGCVGCPDSRKSLTGCSMFLGDALISWNHKKHDCVSKSTSEAKYQAMSAATSKIVWLHGLLAELGCCQTHPVPLRGDNTSSIQIANNRVYHEHEVGPHYIQGPYDRGEILLSHVQIDNHVADIFTKSLTC